MTVINKNITTLSVTYNNAKELESTLESLTKIHSQPKEIIIIDGGSIDGSLDIIHSYQKILHQLIYVSEKDEGIFDAMNKGKKMVRTRLIHYLTAGDIVYGDPYKDINEQCLLPVAFIDENGNECGNDSIKLLGTGYNHQGMIVTANHKDYDTSLWIGADYKMSLGAFPNGMNNDMIINNGGVKYQLGGLSSEKNITGTYHLIIGIFQMRPIYAFPVTFILVVKSLIPRKFRRFLLKVWS